MINQRFHSLVDGVEKNHQINLKHHWNKKSLTCETSVAAVAMATCWSPQALIEKGVDRDLFQWRKKKISTFYSIII